MHAPLYKTMVGNTVLLIVGTLYKHMHAPSYKTMVGIVDKMILEKARKR